MTLSRRRRGRADGRRVDGEFDIVYDDIDKHGYPDAWRAGRERIRIGGLYICDNVLWSGRVVEPDPDRNTSAILEHNRLIAEDDRFVSDDRAHPRRRVRRPPARLSDRGGPRCGPTAAVAPGLANSQ